MFVALDAQLLRNNLSHEKSGIINILAGESALAKYKIKNVSADRVKFSQSSLISSGRKILGFQPKSNRLFEYVCLSHKIS